MMKIKKIVKLSKLRARNIKKWRHKAVSRRLWEKLLLFLNL